jgi:undecaprenyl pyrophosphate phosphatase UppP
MNDNNFFPSAARESKFKFPAIQFAGLLALLNLYVSNGWRLIVSFIIAVIVHFIYTWTPLYLLALVVHVTLLYKFGAYRVEIQKIKD